MNVSRRVLDCIPVPLDAPISADAALRYSRQMRNNIIRTQWRDPAPLDYDRDRDCLCHSEAMHLLTHAHLPWHGAPDPHTAIDFGMPDDLYDTVPEALDPDAGMPRAYHGPPAGMDRRHKQAKGAPRPLCAPTDVPLPINPYRPYAYREDIKAMDQHLTLSGLAKCLYTVLASFFRWATGACFPARATILRSLVAAWGPVSDYAFRQALNELRRAGLISWDRGGEGHSNRYRFHLIERLVELKVHTWQKLAQMRNRPPKPQSPSNSVVRRRVNLLSQIQREIQGSPHSLLLGEMSGEAFDRRGWGVILSYTRWVLDRMSANIPAFEVCTDGSWF